MNRFIIVGTGKDYVKRVWASLIPKNEVQWFDYPFKTDNKIAYHLCHLHSSFFLNQFISLPFKSVWRKIYSFENAIINDKDQYYLILFDNTLARYSPKVLEAFKKKHPNVVLVLFMDNAMYKKTRLILKHLKNVDLIYTNNYFDSEKYGFRYVFNILPPIEDNKKVNINLDVFYIGSANDRLDIIHSVYDRLDELGLRVKMYVTGTKIKKSDRRKNIVYNKKLSYNDVISFYNRSNCLLEVVGKRPTMLTMRTMEAVVRNKKLITNHPFIKEQDFYDSKYILLFNTASDIKIEFFTNNKEVKYNFVNEYTPEKFLERVVLDYSKLINKEGCL